MNSTETIVAIATPPGRGGIGIVRLSGENALTIAQHISRQTHLPPRQVLYSDFFSKSGELIDKGLLIYFKGPQSFTGEDVVEFQGHGSPVVLDYLVNNCLAWGARMARPGEFSERAFLNDKIDLAQAEAIADLIHASTLSSARLALRSIEGEFSRQITQISEKILHFRVYVEAAIDFPDEEIDFLSDQIVNQKMGKILAEVNTVIARATQGAILREGLSLVIAGPPNAGKSTLINMLTGKDVAIVTDIPGTTRDVRREYVLMDDLPVHLIDTAGLRESEDPVESEGIKRAWQEVEKADCVLFLSDIHQLVCPVLNQNLLDHLAPAVPIIRIFNKIDSLKGPLKKDQDAVYISARSGEGIDVLKEKIRKAVGYQPTEGQFLARRRHLNALDRTQAFLLAGEKQMGLRSFELLAEDLRLAHQALTEITGEFSSDDLLGEIFSTFCIGK